MAQTHTNFEAVFLAKSEKPHDHVAGRGCDGLCVF